MASRKKIVSMQGEVQKALGQHLLLELYKCPPKLLSEPEEIEQIMRQAAEAMGTTIVQSNFHHFQPLGVSGVIVIQESHLTIHTWPEHGYAAVDVFTCGDIDIVAGIELFKRHLQPKHIEQQLLLRGLGLSSTNTHKTTDQIQPKTP